MAKTAAKKQAVHSPFYLTLTPYKATAYAEGFCEGEDASWEDQRDAWQYIYDNKLYLHLQGWFGRMLETLINDGEVIA